MPNLTNPAISRGFPWVEIRASQLPEHSFQSTATAGVSVRSGLFGTWSDAWLSLRGSDRSLVGAGGSGALAVARGERSGRKGGDGPVLETLW